MAQAPCNPGHSALVMTSDSPGNHEGLAMPLTSRYTALVLAQVNRQIYTLYSPELPELPSFFTYIAPVKSIPVTLKGGPSCTLASGSGGGSGIGNGLPTTR